MEKRKKRAQTRPIVTWEQIRQLASECVNDMGDVFWDWKPEYAEEERGEYGDPFETARDAVENVLRAFAKQCKVPVRR